VNEITLKTSTQNTATQYPVFSEHKHVSVFIDSDPLLNYLGV
jgi:hypothetical protein